MEIRRVGLEGFDEIYPLLAEFNNARMSRDDWQQMLFTYPWPAPCRHGFGYYVDGKMVGFMGAIFSTRVLDGRAEPFCNLSTWIVQKEFRGTSVLLTRRLIEELAGYTLVGFTPAPTTCKVFSRLGFVSLETEQLLLLPVARPRAFWGALAGSFTSSPRKLTALLEGPSAVIHRDLASCRRIHHTLLTHGGRWCYLVARRDQHKRLPVAEILYMSDVDFFWEHRVLAHAGLLRATGTALLAVDSRFEREGRGRLAWRVPRQRIYRPARSDIHPTAIDGLYSELMTLRE
jgi:hypothetical protein